MINLKMTTSALAILLLTACAGMQQADRNAQRIFTYDFALEGKSQIEIFQAAQIFIASNYGNANAVLSLIDPTTGTMVGSGASRWTLVSNNCAIEHHIRFAAKDGKARLQFELMTGSPTYNSCSGWDWPSKSGYAEIVRNLNGFAQNLERTLLGETAAAQFSDF